MRARSSPPPCRRLAVVLFILLLAALHDAPSHARTTSRTAALERIRVILVPHSHDDVGWLKTYDQYAEGWNSTLQNAHVGLIYDSVVDALQDDDGVGGQLPPAAPRRIFTAVEMAFFAPWYARQSDDRKAAVSRLVQSGRLQFAGGGWVMHDEASPSWIDMVDQMTLGHDFLMATFGIAPNVTWQIDPFGHSAAHVRLFSQAAGIHATFHSRVDYANFAGMQRRQAREYLWTPVASSSPASPGDSTVFASMMTHSTYCPPEWLNFDLLVAPNHIGNYRGSSATRLRLADALDEAYVDALDRLIRADAAVTRGRTVLLPMGCDFAYQQARTWYEAMDFLAARLANRSSGRFTFEYGSPSSYVEAKAAEVAASAVASTPDHQANDVIATAGTELGRWPTSSGDEFPYADGPDAVWSGFFTSRPSLKRMMRRSSSLCRAARLVHAKWCLTAKANRSAAFALWMKANLRRCREAVAVAQHHDAITGTSKQHVAFDYASMLSSGDAAAVKVIRFVVNGAPPPTTATSDNDAEWCPTAHNQTVCVLADRWLEAPLATQIQVTAVNTVSFHRVVTLVVPFNVPTLTYAARLVNSSAGSVVLSTFVTPALQSDDRVRTCGAYRGDASVSKNSGGECQPYSVNIRVALPALGVANVVVGLPPRRPSPTSPAPPPQKHERRVQRAALAGSTDVTVGSVSLHFSADARHLIGVTRNGTRVDARLGWCARLASGGTATRPQPSGAYVLRFEDDDCAPLESLAEPSTPSAQFPSPFVVVLITDSVAVLEQRVSPFLTQRLTVAANDNAAADRFGRVVDDADVTVQYWMDELPIVPRGGVEVFVRFVTESATTSTGLPPCQWLGDSNGLELLRRPCAELPPRPKPLPAYFYPITSQAVIPTARGGVDVSFFTDVPVAAAVVRSSDEASGNTTTALEVLVQRRLLLDDMRGVGEPLNETATVLDYTFCAQRVWAAGPEGGCGARIGGGIRVSGRFGLALVDHSSDGHRLKAAVARAAMQRDAWLSPVVQVMTLLPTTTTSQHWDTPETPSAMPAPPGGDTCSVATVDAETRADDDTSDLRLRVRVLSRWSIYFNGTSFRPACDGEGAVRSVVALLADGRAVALPHIAPKSLTFNRPLKEAVAGACTELAALQSRNDGQGAAACAEGAIESALVMAFEASLDDG